MMVKSGCPGVAQSKPATTTLMGSRDQRGTFSLMGTEYTSTGRYTNPNPVV